MDKVLEIVGIWAFMVLCIIGSFAFWAVLGGVLAVLKFIFTVFVRWGDWPYTWDIIPTLARSWLDRLGSMRWTAGITRGVAFVARGIGFACFGASAILGVFFLICVLAAFIPEGCRDYRDRDLESARP